MKMTMTEAMQIVSELMIFVDLAQSPDTRWDALQDWLKCHPRWQTKVKHYVNCTPAEAVKDLRIYIGEMTGFSDMLINMAITPQVEAQARAAIVRLQTLYRERQITQARTQGYVSEEWIVDGRPIPTGHKTIGDYQDQLKAKKKRKRKDTPKQ
jgi:hypothetical protein